MSNHWSLHCLRCDKYAGDINNGDRDDYWPTVVRNWPVIKPAWEARSKITGRVIEMTILIYGDHDATAVWDFLKEHYEHGIEMVSEYDSCPSVILTRELMP